MRLTSVTLYTSETSEGTEFSIAETESNTRFQVRSIVGIDAEEIVPKFYANGLADGANYFEYTMKPREIVMRVVLNPQFYINETVSEIRDELYRLISANRKGMVTIQFNSGGAVARVIKGLVTKFEVGHFARVPEVQITFYCPDPMFRGSNPVIYEDAALPDEGVIKLPDSSSTSPHGFKFQIIFGSSTASFTIQNKASSPDWKFTVTPPSPFVFFDILEISSEYGAKRVHRYGSSPAAELMDRVSSDSVWPQIFPGQNEFYILPDANCKMIYAEYKAAYWGL